jgi:hypothetical protein
MCQVNYSPVDMCRVNYSPAVYRVVWLRYQEHSYVVLEHY